MSASAEGVTILCSPLAPARTGNGLAMRAGVLLESLAGAGPVDLVVVPAAGPAVPLDWARAHARSVHVIGPPTEADARAQLDRQLADPWTREKLRQTEPLPVAARWAPPPWLVSEGSGLGSGGVRAVVGLRLSLAPFAVALARALGASRVVVDADDDDVALLRALGRTDDADAMERLGRAWLPEADEVWAASAADAATLQTRYGVRAREVPNAVRLPRDARPAPSVDPRGGRLLFVGNLTYLPNLDAARVLAFDVLPRVQAARPDATLALVGAHGPGALDDVARQSGVTVAGAVADLVPYYASTDVVVVPLRYGSGTRIKVLEAATFGRAVVASSVAVAGLDLDPDREVVVADGPDATAVEVLRLLDDPDRAASLTHAANAKVCATYGLDAVGATIRAALAVDTDVTAFAARVLWNRLVVHGPEEVCAALAAILPTAEHDLPVGETLRYDVERDRRHPGGFRVHEAGDLLGVVESAASARDLVHARFHRRVFERASRAGWVRLHGALVDLGPTRTLLTGPEGAGKSTLALRLLLDGFAVQGDESVLLRGREAVAVPRPLHLKPGTEVAVPELAKWTAQGDRLPVVDGVRIADPRRFGAGWRLTVAPVDHVVVLSGLAPADGVVRCRAVAQTEVLPDLVDALFPVTESKAALLGALTRSLAGVACHRLDRAQPPDMVRALRAGVG